MLMDEEAANGFELVQHDRFNLAATLGKFSFLTICRKILTRRRINSVERNDGDGLEKCGRQLSSGYVCIIELVDFTTLNIF